jgi:hypothetical protein|tara:strand:- start:34162 stop:35283 length:1122 start_codon:yes stop_codon:yes gene_type:complete
MDDNNKTDAARQSEAERAPDEGRAALPWFMVIALLFFSLGMIANPWFEREVRSRLPWVGQEADLGSVSARLNSQDSEIAQLETRVASLERRAPPSDEEDDGGSQAERSGTREGPRALNDPVLPQLSASLNTDRIVRIESRIEAVNREQSALDGRVDNLSAEVAGLTVRVQDSRGEAASRMAEAERLAGDARAVLLLGRARTLFDSAEPLGVVGPALQAALDPSAGEMIDQLAAGMRELVGPEQLRRRFERLKPALLGSAEEASSQSFWERTKASIADIFTIRRSGAEDPGTENERIVARISESLDQGDIETAVRAFATLPESVRQQGARWWIDAANYVRTEQLLDRLESRIVSPPTATQRRGDNSDSSESESL